MICSNCWVDTNLNSVCVCGYWEIQAMPVFSGFWKIQSVPVFTGYMGNSVYAYVFRLFGKFTLCLCFQAIWENQFYYLFGFLFLVFIILIVSVSQISVVMVYFQLCGEVLCAVQCVLCSLCCIRCPVGSVLHSL